MLSHFCPCLPSVYEITGTHYAFLRRMILIYAINAICKICQYFSCLPCCPRLLDSWFTYLTFAQAITQVIIIYTACFNWTITPRVAELQPFHDSRQTCHRINKLVRFQLTPFLLVLFFVRSASRVSYFLWSLASSVSSNTCLCLCGWNLYPDTSASVK